MIPLSKGCVYGIRACVYVATCQDGREYVPIREVADTLGISFHFLTKVLQLLTERGILLSYRGPHGGIALARPAKDIHVRLIIECLDGDDLFTGCILGLEGCGERQPCPIHKDWVMHRKGLSEMFERTNLEQLAADIMSGTKRLSDLVGA